MNNENSNTKPNLDFILSQPDPGPSKNKSRKTVLIGSVVVVLALVLLAVGVTAVVGNSSKKQATNATTAAVVTKNFMTYLQTADMANLLKATHLVSTPKGVTSGYVTASLSRLQDTIEFRSCQQKGNPTSNNTTTTTVYTCPSKTKPGTNVTITVEVQKNQKDQLLVTAYKVKTNA